MRLRNRSMSDFGVRIQFTLVVDILFRWSISLGASVTSFSQFVLGFRYLRTLEYAMTILIAMVSAGVALLPVPGAKLHLRKGYDSGSLIEFAKK
jgi:hypothetical protein